MKKVILLVGVVLAFAGAVAAQTTTKVSKQIKVLPWLNTAVIDANDAAGGMHTYASWATLGTNLKTSQVQLGMLVTIEADKATYRLKSWAINTALPALGEWERVGDMVVVADISTRNGLIVTDNSKVSLAPGTTVVVKDNGKGVAESFIYAAGLFDANGDGTVKTDGTDDWYSASGTSAGSGYVFFEEAALGTSASTHATGWFKGAAASGAITIGTTARLSGMPTGVKFSLNAGANVPVVALPAAWANPTFYINDGTSTYQLLDCWVKSYQTIDGISYQLWVADTAFETAIPAGSTLIVQ